MSYSIKEVQEQKVFVINYNGEVEQTTLYDHIMESVDTTTTPRGVAPRNFIEEGENGDFIISSWGVGGNNYTSGKYNSFNVFETLEEAEQELFDRTYKYDFAQDDQRDTNWFDTETEAYADLWQVDFEVAESILRKKDKMEEVKLAKIQSEKTRVSQLAEIYAKTIQPIESEKFKETAKRLSEALPSKIESKVFFEAVKQIRNK